MKLPMYPRLTASHAPAGARWARAGAGLGLALVLLTLSGCFAAREVPGNLEFVRDSTVDWVDYVVGAEPPQY